MNLDALERRLSGPPVTRFAPSPTGHLHAGHVMNAVYVWGIAGALGGRVVLRMEDHDQGRYRREYEDSILEDLDWLGFRAHTAVPRQSDNDSAYASALTRLKSEHELYFCDCSRKALANRTGPGTPEGSEIPYDGFCRGRALIDEPDASGARPGLRLVLPGDAVAFDDAALGALRQKPAEQCGDLLLRDRRGDWTYQFSVVVDDFNQDVDLVIRGMDLVESTGRQILLGRMLGRKEEAIFLHHPLLMEGDGRKLSKRHGSSGIREAREAGVSAAEYLGDIAARCGLLAEPRPLVPEELPELFKEPGRS